MNRHFKLYIVGLVSLCMLMAPGALAQTTLAPDQYEPNNSQSSAANLGSATSGNHLVIQANFHSSDDTSDWYVVKVENTASSEKIFTISLSSTASADLYLSSDKPVEGLPANSSGTTITLVVNGWGGVGGEGDRTFYINVRRGAGVVGNEDYSLTLFAGKLLEPPVITSLTPSQGPVGAKVSILGTNLDGTSSVKFNGVTAAITARSATSITTNVPIGATTGPIMVISPAGAMVVTTAFTVTSETTPPSKKGGISPASPDKKQPPSVKSGTTHAPSSKVPDAKAPKKRKDPKSNCIGLGCGEDEPICIGMGCGETAPICVGMGCEKQGAAVPNESGPTGAAKLPPVQKPTIYGISPCCNIVTIAANGIVTAQDSVTGKTFQFQAKDQALTKSLHIGQNVYADFGTQQVSVDGAAPCCGIVSAASGPAGAAKIP
jgi:hypothetical protein